MTPPLNSPNPDQIEIVLFGPGYGESILAHLGNDHWIIVDSCIDYPSGYPAPINYLQSIGKNPADVVDIVIATHWHDDHIRGIGKTLEECKKAKFCAAGALSKEEFISVVTRHEENNTQMKVRSGVRELRKVYEILDHRGETGSSPKKAIADRLLHRITSSESLLSGDCEIYSLSPSDRQIDNFYQTIGSMFPPIGMTRQSIPSPSTNDISVVILIKIGEFAILLGSDLEETSDPQTGWSVILNSTERPQEKASIFKVSHHGSENGHHQGVWENMLKENPIATLSPFRRGRTKLPQDKDIQRIKGLTSTAFLSSKKYPPKEKKYPKAVERMMNSSARVIHSSKGEMGSIRLRNSGENRYQFWGVEFFGPAYQI
ncbi:MAG: MBL fold metallo-hydrolase [Nitrospina sp.]|jgi:hypothetical protein|nr:MBL fold metallo-hydrolase [Nitrospina sp.]